MGLSRSITGNDKRGSSYDRRARRAWLLTPAAGWGGDGEKVPCSEPGCGAMVNARTMYVDRIIPGEQGGTYRRNNIKPHCASCSHRQGQRRLRELIAARSAYGDDDRCKVCGAHFLATHAVDCTVPEVDR